MTDNRALIARYIRDYPGSKPADIAEALDIKPDTARQTLSRMARAGQLRATAGTYHPPASTTCDSQPAMEVSQVSQCHNTLSDQHEQV
jgi:DNA-binding IclR family transcriptional regulator